MGKTDIVDRVLVGYRNGHSLGNDAAVPIYETRVNQRRRYTLHMTYHEPIDKNGGLNMNEPQEWKDFDVRTFYNSYNDLLKGMNGTRSFADMFNISLAKYNSMIGPENAAMPALGLGNATLKTDVAAAELLASYSKLAEEAAMDCSDFAYSIQKATKGGTILEFTPKTGKWMKGLEFGEKVEFQYHQVFEKEGYIYDPMYGEKPVKMKDYMAEYNKMNPEGLKIENVQR